jgi:hypothetical protein
LEIASAMFILPFYCFTVSPFHRFTVSPFHRFTVLPFHRFTVSPFHRFTVLLFHRFTVSPFANGTRMPRIGRIYADFFLIDPVRVWRPCQGVNHPPSSNFQILKFSNPQILRTYGTGNITPNRRARNQVGLRPMQIAK